jgi:hypothetical protein
MSIFRDTFIIVDIVVNNFLFSGLLIILNLTVAGKKRGFNPAFLQFGDRIKAAEYRLKKIFIQKKMNFVKTASDEIFVQADDCILLFYCMLRIL